MIMCMYKKRIAVSDRQLYDSFHSGGNTESYIDFLAGIAAGEESCLGQKQRPDILIVREKQLSESEYLDFFTRLWEKSRTSECDHAILIPHTYPAAAKQTGSGWLHLPLFLFQKYCESDMLSGLSVGTSVHSKEEAKLAQELGTAYVTAGHVFATDCKKGLEPRGLEFLKTVCDAVRIPVYAIGGIHEQQLPLIWKSGAAGACMMSEYMK